MEKIKVSVASVVRDVAMYERCVLKNPYYGDAELVMIDNRVENRTITRNYNEFLDSIDDDRWIVLCHEDWELKENLQNVLKNLDKNKLYGPIGAFIEEKKNVDVLVMKGGVHQSSKDGGRTIVIRGKEPEGRVDTFDCQCLIFHSSLSRQHSLRFDENLRFDMYVEDFCVNAYEKSGKRAFRAISTAKQALKMSNNAQKIPITLPKTISAFEAPAFPDPFFLMSKPLSLAMMYAGLIEPIK